MHNPIAFHVEMMGDTMHSHQALKQLDASNFVQAVMKEINEHENTKCWELIKHSDVPKNVEIILNNQQEQDWQPFFVVIL